MPLDSIVRKAVAIADKVTSSLQVGTSPGVATVSISAWIGQSPDGRGGSIYASPVNSLAIVEYGGEVADSVGRQVETFAHLTFPRPLAPNGTPGRQEPIDVRDRILVAGRTGPIVKISGFADPSIGRPFMTEVWLGK